MSAEATLKETCERLREIAELIKQLAEIQEKSMAAISEGFATLHRDINRKPKTQYIG